ncbi:conserved hypothetical protein [Teredinibacter turnerae T7901]|uniref:Uncharacterized protein n=1 Tax=Teredinibacter turnerae (strain ATCC 39867 / T7901) TaxID=377629 RepID=C6AR14_TERTT|nr:conserved hypothetical protein [Teredinibacter turnerae T7901]
MDKYIKVVFFLLLSNVCISAEMPTSARSKKAIANVKPELVAQLKRAGLEYGNPIYIRILKKHRNLSCG